MTKNSTSFWKNYLWYTYVLCAVSISYRGSLTMRLTPIHYNSDGVLVGGFSSCTGRETHLSILHGIPCSVFLVWRGRDTVTRLRVSNLLELWLNVDWRPIILNYRYWRFGNYWHALRAERILDIIYTWNQRVTVFNSPMLRHQKSLGHY